MTSYNKTLKLLASKIGLDDEKILSKAAEFERLLLTKSIAGSNITDTSKAVICLDLAASMLGSDLDMKTAIKYSGLKPASYTNSRKVIENLLELNIDKITVNMICAALQCGGAQALAEDILNGYQKQSKMNMDLNLPQYVCMAVYQACRVNKIKLSKSKIIEKSRLKPSQWSKLDVEWSKFVDANFTVKKKRGRPAKEAIEDDIKMDIEIPKLEIVESQIESYQDWKKRMLETAFRELKEIEEKESEHKSFGSVTPRRSPRKTPQKFTPYLSPKKPQGVRNLFRND